MTNNPISDALALRATASGFDAQRGKLPVPGDPHRSPDSFTVARQISELGKLITDLADEVLHRSAEQNRESSTAPAITGFTAALRPAGQAASALGTVARQLSFLDQTEHLSSKPDIRDAREAVEQVIGTALRTANVTLREAADALYVASATVLPPSVRIQAARSRSAGPVSAPGPLPPASPTPAPPNRIARSR
ncbi:hypothetical protein ACFYXP_20975 [Streptomyces sp. NPDC002466]|uniref:hypothetical protein n=1 Tax=Streptomyces sp. NPDC002466 TaxID=3364646 RepID=UPI003684CF4A